MRIAVSAENKSGLDSVVSPHFGRCPHYILVDVKGHDVTGIEEVDSPFYGHHQPGQVPGFINSLGADVMLAGGMGGRAIMFFEQYGIEGVTGAYGTVRQSVERYLGGQLKGAAPCKESQEHGHSIPERIVPERLVPERSGVGSRVGGDLPGEGEFEQDELGRLKEEAEMLRRQMEEVTDRLGRIG
jgi:predicted Fe-Mo cluster-binding NifX family protein